MNSISKESYHLTGTHHHITSNYHAQANGLVSIRIEQWKIASKIMPMKVKTSFNYWMAHISLYMLQSTVHQNTLPST